MPWTVENPPKCAKNWTEAEKKKCVKAANAALREGSSEEDAIFACIRAAGKTKHPGGGKEITVEIDVKAVTKQEADCAHPSSHYLVVEDSKKPSTWHLRVRNCNGKPDHRLMGAAWAALHGGYRGNKYSGPQKSQAIGKLKRLYSSEGMEVPSEKEMSREAFGASLREAFYTQFPLAPDADIKETPLMVASYDKYVVVQRGQRFYKVPYKGDAPDFSFTDQEAWAEVEPGWLKKGFSGFKALPGGKWVGWWTNAFKDREEELFYTQSIEEFIDWWDKSNEPLPLRWWHVPHDLGATEWVGLGGRIAMAAGTLTKEGQVFADYYEAHPEVDVGMSHGFKWDMRLVDGEGGYMWFRTQELSFLPRDKAANPFTMFGGTMRDDKKEALAEIIGAEEAEKWVQETEEKSKEIEDSGVRFKEVEEPKKEEQPVAEKEEEVEEPQLTRMVMDEAVLDGIADKVVERLGPVLGKVAEAFQPVSDAMEKQNKELHDAFDVLLKADDKKVKEILSRLPKVETYRATMKETQEDTPAAVVGAESPKDILNRTLAESINAIAASRS